MEYYERLTAQDSARLAHLDAWLDIQAARPNISIVAVEKQRQRAQLKINKLKKRLKNE